MGRTVRPRSGSGARRRPVKRPRGGPGRRGGGGGGWGARFGPEAPGAEAGDTWQPVRRPWRGGRALPCRAREKRFRGAKLEDGKGGGRGGAESRFWGRR